MKPAYNNTWLYNLLVTKESKRWHKSGFISKEQVLKIQDAYVSGFYHPNFIIRILLFVAALLALSGVTGLGGLMIADAEDEVIWVCCILYGIGSFVILEKFFISKNNHFKSGVNEALLYHACGFVIGGTIALTEGDSLVIFISCILVFTFASIRYLDLVTTFAAFCSFGGFIFFELYDAGGVYQQVIPFTFIIVFGALYFVIKKLQKQKRLSSWTNNLILVEGLTLLAVYASGNYFVMRELSISMMDLYLEEGQDIPFAFIFYVLTVSIPVSYLYFGIKNKDVVLLRVSLLAFAFSVFTFKYYYGFGHPEYSLTLAGALVIIATLMLLNYLKTYRNGFTRENLLAEKWGSMNIQAIVISQTMGGNHVPVQQEGFKGGGGEFGGGGATGNY
jgi:hypothetical protein